MKKTHKDYADLHELGRHIHTLQGINQLLDWDMETHMPQGAAAIRSSQIETLSGIIHELKTEKKFTTALNKLIDIKTGTLKDKTLSSEQQAAVREWRRDYIKDTALPQKFVTELAKLTSQSIIAWREAKKNNTFHTFAPFLEKLIEMEKKKADFLGYNESPYDALLDLYEPESTAKNIGSLFAGLKKSINELLKKIAKAKPIDDHFLHGKFSQEKQLSFAKKILEDIGYNSTRGRLDISTHPFCSTPHPSDCRITTRIHATSLVNCVSTVLHEVGHALYEMGLAEEHYGSPLGSSVSLGVHESQSRWWEIWIGQGKPFWQHYLPLLKKQFPGKLDKINLETFYKALNKVEPSFIRVDADEVTYPLHIILRFEMERDLIEGKLAVKEIPEAWNSKMKELLGITPPTDAQGCLQDIHWAMGGFGYFPTYALGNLYAAHLFEAFTKQHRNWEERIAKGELGFIREWLYQAVHQHGRRYSSLELLKKATGKKFTTEAYTRYLDNKYSKLYSFTKS